MLNDLFSIIEDWWWVPPLLSIAWCATVIRFRRRRWIRPLWLLGVIALAPLPVIGFVLIAEASVVMDTPGPGAPMIGYVWLIGVALLPFVVPLGLALYFRPIRDQQATDKNSKEGEEAGSTP